MAAITNSQIINLVGEIPTARIIECAMRMVKDTCNITNMRSRAGRRLIAQIENTREYPKSFVENIYLREDGMIAFHIIPGLHNADAETAKFAEPFREFMKDFEKYDFFTDDKNPGIIIYKNNCRSITQRSKNIFQIAAIAGGLKNAANSAANRKGWRFK